MNIAQKIKTERKANKWTQAELAEKTGLPQSSISEWENGTKMPTAPAIIKLCDAFEITADELLGRSDY